jgi:mannitol/fructose-specific phosphotransferase system IIA component (Ntr-type)
MMRDVARMFDAPVQTVEQWMRDDGLPHQWVHGQVRFQRADLLRWANDRGVHVAHDPDVPFHPFERAPRVSDALAVGGIHSDVGAEDRESLLREMIERMPFGEEEEREMLSEVFLAHESSWVSCAGDGIAILHVRSPSALRACPPAIALCFLRRPIDSGTNDHVPVHTVFTIVSLTIRTRLVLLARLAAALRDGDFRRAVIDRAPAEKLLLDLRAAEERSAWEPTESSWERRATGRGR